MMKPIQSLFCFLSLIALFTACNKDELDAIYGPPDDMSPPIYQQLKDRGNFKSMLAVIDKAGYKEILGKAGYWTLFAPDDDAFQRFFQQQNLANVDAIDKETAAKIVRYNTIYNSYRKDNISTFESPERILEPGKSFRKKSTYYDFVYAENGKKYLANNTNFGFYYVDDNNNKYLPFFTREFFKTTGVTEQDYDAFFPGVSFDGFNVLDAKVINADIIAANGIIHQTDKVLMPLQNIEQYLATKPEYSEFKKLLDKKATYFTYYKLQNRYKALTGSEDSVFIKTYNGLSFAPNNENYSVTGSSDAQANSWSIAVPTNAQLTAYKDELLKDWGSNELSASMAYYLINSHLWNVALWPGKLTTTGNSLGERITFKASDVIEKKMLSNGNFYGVDKVQEANVFRTVYSKPFLNKDYLLQTRGLNNSLFREITDPTNSRGLIMQSDEQFKNLGYSYDELVLNYSYKNPVTGTTIVDDVAKERYFRILNMSVFDNSFLNLTDLSGEGMLKGSLSEGGTEEYIKYSGNKIYAAGNVETNTPVTVTKVVQTVNGPVFYTNGSLKFTEKRLGISIKDLATEKPLIFGDFYDYLKNTAIWKNNGDAIEGITLGVEYTVLIPTNQAIREAVKRGELPGNITTGVPAITPTTQVDKDKIINFIYYHILEKETVAPDGDPFKQGKMQTAFKDVDAASPETFIYITSQKGSMQFMDAKGTSNVNLILSDSNVLADRCLIHSIDRVLKSK